MTSYLPRHQSNPPSSSPIESEFPPIYLNTPDSSPKNSNQDIDDEALADVSFASSISITTSSPSPHKYNNSQHNDNNFYDNSYDNDFNDLNSNYNKHTKSNLHFNDLKINDQTIKPSFKPVQSIPRGKKRIGLPSMWAVTKESFSPPNFSKKNFNTNQQQSHHQPQSQTSKRNAVMFDTKNTIIPSPATTSSSSPNNQSMQLDNSSDFASQFPPLRPRAPSEPSKPDHYYHLPPSPRLGKKPRLSPLKPPFMAVKSLGRAYSAPGKCFGQPNTISTSSFNQNINNVNNNSFNSLKSKSTPFRERRPIKKSRPPMPSFDQNSPSLFNNVGNDHDINDDNKQFAKPTFRRAFSLAAPNPPVGIPSPGLDSSPCAPSDASPSIRPLSQQISKPNNRPLGPIRALSALQGPVVSPRGIQIPGFGHSEMEGKSLPCFSVKDDGLMRVEASTLNKLLCEPLPQNISDVHVIDCRFPFEFEGGHIPGAVNLGTLQAVENHFLIPNAGVNKGSKTLPTPTTSSSYRPDDKRKVIIFHCEFSNMRAPTLAKHLRSLDRSRNEFPNLHFPELYILSGGYAEYYNQFNKIHKNLRYTPMDAPNFHPEREAHLAAFRASSKPSQGFLNMGLRSKSFTFASRSSNRLTTASKLLQDQTVTEESDTSFEGGSPCANFIRPQSTLNRAKSLAKLTESSPLKKDTSSTLNRDLTFIEHQ